MKVFLNGTLSDVYISVSTEEFPLIFPDVICTTVCLQVAPPSFCADGREGDANAIVTTIRNAKRFVHVAVMDYAPATVFSKPNRLGPFVHAEFHKIRLIDWLIDWPIDSQILASYRWCTAISCIRSRHSGAPADQQLDSHLTRYVRLSAISADAEWCSASRLNWSG